MMAREFVIFFEWFFLGFHWIFVTSRLFLTLILQKRRKSVFPLFGRNIIYSRKLRRISKNQVKWSNFHVESQVTRRSRAKYGLPCWGSSGLGVVRIVKLSWSAGLQDYEDTRLKTSSRVPMGLSLAWKASLAIRICRSPTIVTDSV